MRGVGRDEHGPESWKLITNSLVAVPRGLPVKTVRKMRLHSKGRGSVGGEEEQKLQAHLKLLR